MRLEVDRLNSEIKQLYKLIARQDKEIVRLTQALNLILEIDTDYSTTAANIAREALDDDV